jgi:hypothetical protein
MLPVLLACAFGFVSILAYWLNRDLVSPVKLYLLTLLICFFDIFVTPYRLEICCIYLGLLTIPLILSFYESSACGMYAGLVRKHSRSPSHRGSGTKAVVLLWTLTIIPIASMTYLVVHFGGLADYLSQLPSRHLAFQGLNSFSELAINLISLLTVLYFGIGIVEKRRTGFWLLYLLHFTIAFTILSMSGSRRSLLMPFIMILALSHYFRSVISVRRASLWLVSVLALTSILGVLRIGQRGAASFERNLSDVEQESITAHFKYGLVPLEVIFNVNVLNLRYGSTFLAAATNVIPRPMWPGKPDSAGLAITQDYLGNRWLGASNLNAGFIVESIMNFGFVIGIVFSFVGLVAAMAFITSRYHQVMTVLHGNDRSIGAVFYLVRYLHLAIAVTSLPTWETAVVSVPLIINLTAIMCIERLLAAGSSPRRSAVKTQRALAASL